MRGPDGPNWTIVQAVTSRLLADSDRLADVLLERQRQAVSELDSAASPEEAQAHARWLVREFLRGIGDASPPSPEQIAHCREFGASRARQSLPASAMVQGYHLAHRELWQRLIEEVLAQPGVGPALLADMFGYGLQWLNGVVEAVNSGFQIQAAEDRNAREQSTRRLVSLLETAETASDQVRALAAGLGFDPDGEFYAVHGHPPAASSAPAFPETRPVQGTDPDAVLGPPSQGERWGIGARRRGMSGARQSIIDAKLAYAALGEHGGRMDFARSWGLCLAHAHREAIDPLVDTARQTAHSRPHLLSAVVAFADAGFSVAQAARTLRVHPNTLGYRLDQWRRLTGLDPRSVSGLTHSLYLAR